MARRTLPRCGRTEILARFHNLIVTACAIAMKRLLISQRNQLSADLKLDLRDFRQELRFGVGSSMTIATNIHFGRSWIFLEQVRR